MQLEYKFGDVKLGKEEMINKLIDTWTDPERMAGEWG